MTNDMKITLQDAYAVETPDGTIVRGIDLDGRVDNDAGSSEGCFKIDAVTPDGEHVLVPGMWVDNTSVITESENDSAPSRGSTMPTAAGKRSGIASR